MESREACARAPLSAARPPAPTATLSEIDIRAELATRPRRRRDVEQEERALVVLATELAANPRHMLQRLVEVAMELCAAHTAGLSLLDGNLCRWEAVAGVFAAARGGTIPRDASPCGVCVNRGTTQLMHLADRCFPALFSEPRFVEALLVPFHDHDTPVGTVWVVSHDLDRRFDSQDERTVQVLSQFASAGWQLWKASDARVEHGRRQDELLTTLAHELRNPLAAITGAASVLKLRAAGDAGSATQAIDVIARQGWHVSRLVHDLVDIVRIDNEKLELDKRRVDLRELVSTTMEARWARGDDHRHQWTLELGHEPILLDADPVRLTQIVSNLLDNAAKYTPEGGEIAISAAASGGEARVAVRDTGVGIGAAELHDIFDWRTQGWPEVRAQGAGLGLTLVRSLAELHGGTVQASSDGPGQGSCFTVRLPVLATDAARPTYALPRNAL